MSRGAPYGGGWIPALSGALLALAFPPFELLVPAFVLVLIPPLLASGLAGLSGLWPNT